MAVFLEKGCIGRRSCQKVEGLSDFLHDDL